MDSKLLRFPVPDLSRIRRSEQIPVYHTVCRGVAFYLVEMPGQGVPLRSDMVRLLDGSRPLPGSPMICGSCNQQLVANAETHRVGGLSLDKPEPLPLRRVHRTGDMPHKGPPIKKKLNRPKLRLVE